MVKIAPKIYRQHVIYEKLRLVLYVTLNGALCGCLRLEFMFYERLVADMRDKGLELNPYGLCMAKKYLRQENESLLACR